MHSNFQAIACKASFHDVQHQSFMDPTHSEKEAKPRAVFHEQARNGFGLGHGKDLEEKVQNLRKFHQLISKQILNFCEKQMIKEQLFHQPEIILDEMADYIFQDFLLTQLEFTKELTHSVMNHSNVLNSEASLANKLLGHYSFMKKISDELWTHSQDFFKITNKAMVLPILTSLFAIRASLPKLLEMMKQKLKSERQS